MLHPNAQLGMCEARPRLRVECAELVSLRARLVAWHERPRLALRCIHSLLVHDQPSDNGIGRSLQTLQLNAAQPRRARLPSRRSLIAQQHRPELDRLRPVRRHQRQLAVDWWQPSGLAGELLYLVRLTRARVQAW